MKKKWFSESILSIYSPISAWVCFNPISVIMKWTLLFGALQMSRIFYYSHCNQFIEKCGFFGNALYHERDVICALVCIFNHSYFIQLCLFVVCGAENQKKKYYSVHIDIQIHRMARIITSLDFNQLFWSAPLWPQNPFIMPTKKRKHQVKTKKSVEYNFLI